MGGDDLKNLQQLRYQIGDYITLAIVEPKLDIKTSQAEKNKEEVKEHPIKHDVNRRYGGSMKRDKERRGYD